MLRVSSSNISHYYHSFLKALHVLPKLYALSFFYENHGSHRLGILEKVGNFILCFAGLERKNVNLSWWFGILFRGYENVKSITNF